MSSLRPYQAELKRKAREKRAQGVKRILIQLVTGGGKTNLAEDVLRDAESRGSTAWFVAHRDNLITQAARRFRAAGLEVGVIKSGHKYQPEIAIQVASIGSLGSRYAKVKAPDLIFIDEAHHSLSNQYRALFEAYPDATFIGLTGTPWLLDGRGLCEAFEEMITGPAPSWMIAEGFLLPSRVIGSRRKLGSIQVGPGGDFDLAKAEEVLARKEVTGDAVATFLELFPVRGRGVTFTCSVAHGGQVVEAYNAAGVSAEILTGETPEDEREAIIERITQEKTRQLVVIDCASEGFDLPELDCVTLLRPSASLTLALQQIARAIRPVYAPGFDLDTREGRHAAIQASGKTHATVIDCVSNTLRHGIPELDHEWSLDPQDRKARAASKTEDGETLAVRQCLECYAIHPTAPACPQCGHEHPVESRIPKARAEELREIEKSELERLHRERQKKGRPRRAVRRRSRSGSSSHESGATSLDGPISATSSGRARERPQGAVSTRLREVVPREGADDPERDPRRSLDGFRG